MDEKLIEAPEGGRAGYRVRLMICAAVMGAARLACFFRAYAVGLNVTVFTLVWLACTWIVLDNMKVLDRKKFFVGAVQAVLLAFSAAWTMHGFIQAVSRLGIVIVMGKLVLDCFGDNRGQQFGGYIRDYMTMICAGIVRIAAPVSDLISLIRSGRKGRGRAGYIFVGLIISIPLAAIALSLLLSADSVFRSMFTWRLGLDESVVIAVSAVWGFLWVFFAFYCILTGQAERGEEKEKKQARQFDSTVAVTFMGILGVIYLVFCAVQVVFLFGRHALPEGQTYAGYAREGFFQLMFVSAMNVLLIMLCSWKFRQSRVLNTVLTVISGCTYIMIASSACRMMMYVQAYGMSFLRILVLWFLIVLALVMAGALVYIYKKSFDLFKYCYGLCLAMWLLFAYLRPGALAAKYNAEVMGMTGGVTFGMLYELSPDATATLVRNIDRIDDENIKATVYRVLSEEREELGGRDIRGFNLSWQRSERALRQLEKNLP